MELTPIYEVSGLEEVYFQKTGVISLNYTDEKGNSEGEIDTFDVSAAPYWGIPPKKTEVSLKIGYLEKGLTFMGVFIVDECAISGPPDEISVKAKSADFVQMYKEKKDLSYDNTNLQDIHSLISGRLGLTPVWKSDSKVFYDHVAQTEESDYHFIQRLCGEQGLECSIKNGNLIVTDPIMNSVIKEVEAKRITSYSADLLGESDYKGTVAKYYDIEKGELVEIKNGDAPFYIIKREFQNPGEARNSARKKLEHLKRNTVSGKITLPGDPDLYAGGLIVCNHHVFKGKFQINRLNHRIDSSGFSTELDICSV